MMFDKFFDDAAMFPPGNVAMTDAVRSHLARRATPYGAYVGPLVCPVDRIDELAETLEGRHLEVAVVGAPTRPLPPGLTLVAIELKGPVGTVPDVPAGVRIFVELPWGEAMPLPDGAMVKLRCGGDYVPSACQLGVAIAQCVENGVPFKLTAGLHHAIRTDEAHGFLNIFAAVEAALAGLDPIPALLLDDPATLKVRDPATVREVFRSIGTCSIDEPLADLRSLGWLS